MIGGADHADAEAVVRDALGHAGPGELLVDDHLLDLAQPGAAVLAGPCHGEQLVGRPGSVRHDSTKASRSSRLERPQTLPAGGQVLGQERLDLRAVVLRFIAVGRVHGCSLRVTPPRAACEFGLLPGNAIRPASATPRGPCPARRPNLDRVAAVDPGVASDRSMFPLPRVGSDDGCCGVLRAGSDGWADGGASGAGRPPGRPCTTGPAPRPMHGCRPTAARRASSPRAAAEAADAVFLCVGNDDDVRSVVHGPDGVLAGLRQGAVLVDHTTASADLARELAAACAEQGSRASSMPRCRAGRPVPRTAGSP